MNGEINLAIEWEPSPGIALVIWEENECQCEREFFDRDEAIGFAYLMSMDPPKHVLTHYTVNVKAHGGVDVPVCLTASFFDGAYDVK